MSGEESETSLRKAEQIFSRLLSEDEIIDEKKQDKIDQTNPAKR